MFEEGIGSLQDPLQKLRFLLSFYGSKQESLDLDVRRIEKACFRRNDHTCVSQHDEYLLKKAELARRRYKTEQELTVSCRSQRDWVKSVMEPEERAMTINLWLNLHPDCARPHVEKYVGLMKEEVAVLEEAQKTLGSHLQSTSL